jgi:hypothetical protein
VTAADVLRWKRRDPFVPFRVLTDDGAAYTASDPDLLLILADVLLFGRPSAADPRAASGFDVVPLCRVTLLEDLPSR